MLFAKKKEKDTLFGTHNSNGTYRTNRAGQMEVWSWDNGEQRKPRPPTFVGVTQYLCSPSLFHSTLSLSLPFLDFSSCFLNLFHKILLCMLHTWERGVVYIWCCPQGGEVQTEAQESREWPQCHTSLTFFILIRSDIENRPVVWRGRGIGRDGLGVWGQ